MTKIQSGIKITAPITVEGLGCGTDVLAIALDKAAVEIIIHKSEISGIHIKNRSEDKGKNVDALEKNPAFFAATLVWKALIEAHPIDPEIGMELEVRYKTAERKGLGLKEASAVAGAMAINEFFGGLFNKRTLLPLIVNACTTLFSDFSLAALSTSLLGGCMMVCDKETLDVRRLPVPQGLFLVVAYPTMDIEPIFFEVISSSKTTGALAIEQSRMLSGFFWGMYRSDFELIGKSVQSPIFDAYFAEQYNYFDEIKLANKEAGALATGLSRTGPSIFALCTGTIPTEKCSIAIESVFHKYKLRCHILTGTINNEGAILE